MIPASLLRFSQLTVVVKYFFQFGFFPWTTTAYRGVNADRPFALPNIIGVEKKDGYVLFDLIQLLALFFHRSILKVRRRDLLSGLPLSFACSAAQVGSFVVRLCCSVTGSGTTKRWRCLIFLRR